MYTRTFTYKNTWHIPATSIYLPTEKYTRKTISSQIVFLLKCERYTISVFL